MIIGAVNFLNAYPLYWALESDLNHRLVKDSPANLADMLKNNELDLAIISSIEYFKNKGIFSYYPDLCIGAAGKVISIRIFLKKEAIENFYDFVQKSEPVKVYYDAATRSSIAMLKIVLKELNPDKPVEYILIQPPFENLLEKIKSDEMVLLIGDNAIKNREKPSLDLGEVYYKIFHQPFVYAIWVYQKRLSEDGRQVLLNAFEKGQLKMDSMINDAVREFGFEYEFTKKYLTSIIKYELKEEFQIGLEFFFKKFSDLQKLN
jgi:chorismate dehydratase